MERIFNLLKNKFAQQGAATILLTLLLISNITLIVLFSANYSLMGYKITSNQYKNNQAFTAANAGINFGIAYLQKNSTTIVSNPSGGYINYSDTSTTNVSLANGAKFTTVYTNPTANNYKLIAVTSTGKSIDGSATRVISTMVQQGTEPLTNPTAPLITKGSVAMSGNASIINGSSNSTIQSGSTVSITQSASTSPQIGSGSNSSSLGTDVTQNSATLSSLSSGDLFATYFGVPMSVFLANKVNHHYTNSVSTNYNSILGGMTGTVIWIDQTGGSTASINQSTTVGSSSSPVILIVNGNFSLADSANIYGAVYVSGNLSSNMNENSGINGGLITFGSNTLTGDTRITYNNSILNTLQQSNIFFAKVPGSWKDF